MVTRRKVLLASLATAGGLVTVSTCSSRGAADRYEQAVRHTFRPVAVGASNPSALRRELVRCATLAPSSHNTQCWRFHAQAGSISIRPDLARRCPAVDPDDHHLFVSLGCAAENLVQAALANGWHADASFDPAAGGTLRLSLEPTRAVASTIVAAIPERQNTRGDYDGNPISSHELALLVRAGSGRGVELLLLSERAAMETVLASVVAANTAQMSDSAFVAELKRWIRFSTGEALRTGDGLYAASSGNPTVPSWLGRLLFGLVFTPGKENDKAARRIRSASGIAVFASEVESPEQWIEVGRCYERFALQATALGIHTSMLNQPVEVPALRPQFAATLGLAGHRPDLVVRFGRGAKMPSSLRRPVAAVLTESPG